MPPDPPRQSPGIPGLGEDPHPSGNVKRTDFKKYAEELKEELALVQSLTGEETDAKLKKGLDKNLIIAVVAAVSVCFAVFFALRAEAKDIADAGVASQKKELQAHIELENAKLQVIKEQVADVKDDLKDIKKQNAALLRRFSVPDPSPPDSKDGGK